MRYRWIAAAAFALGCSGSAHADWMEASSPHFVIYANDSAQNVTRFSEELELYHHAMEFVTRAHLPDPSPSNRVTIFVVRDERAVQKLYGPNSQYIGGFYHPRAGGSIAIVPKIELLYGPQSYSMISLLHEYAHHFMLSNTDFPMPRWMGEGAAEFFASAEFPREGGIKTGIAANHRAADLFYAKDVKVSQLLDPTAYDHGAHKGFDAFYGKSWLLYHYLRISGARPDQLQKYVNLMAKGESSLQAGKDAFGDLDQLERELDRYLNSSQLTGVVIAPGKLPATHVDVRPLGPGEAAVMPLVIRSRRGVSKEQAAELVTEVRKIAAAYPKDPAVLTELAEAEHDAGNDDASIAAADAALAIDPKRVNAYVQKGYSLFRQAADAAGDKAAAYKKAMAPFVALNKLENDNPLPLIYYFRSFAERGVKPPEQAALGLMRAAELAPYDLPLRLNLAEYQISAGSYAEARGNLVPIAFDPHGSPIAGGARALIERIDSGKRPSLQEAVAIMQPTKGKTDGEGGEAKGG